MKKLMKYLIVVLIVCVLFTFTGCSSIFNKAKDIAKDKIEEEISKQDDEESSDNENDNEDEDVTQDTEVKDDDQGSTDSTAITTSEGDAKDWPGDEMGPLQNVFPKISAVFTTDLGAMISYEGLSKVDAEAYASSLEELGFTEGLSGSEDDSIYFAKSNDKGETVAFSWNIDGTGTLTYSVGE